MVSPAAASKIMGITFILIGVFFFVIGLLMILAMGTLSAFSALGGGGGELGTILALGWIFSLITFAAGIFSIISAALLFKLKE